ncbi:MAG: hypothetical protein ACTHMJ_12050 [Thermomicrobiales bacterium]
MAEATGDPAARVGVAGLGVPPLFGVAAGRVDAALLDVVAALLVVAAVVLDEVTAAAVVVADEVVAAAVVFAPVVAGVLVAPVPPHAASSAAPPAPATSRNAARRDSRMTPKGRSLRASIISSAL